jgi:PBSX family phage terminase large subunit
MKLSDFGEKHKKFIRTPPIDDAWITILEGSVRSGKTVAMIPKLIFSIIPYGAQGLSLITGVSKDTIYDNVLRDLFSVLGSHNYSYNRSTGDLDIMGHPWKVMGAKDEGSEKFLIGKTLANAICDEVVKMPERFFKQLLNRLSIPNSRLYATTNPDTPYHYLYREYITDKEKLASRLVSVIHFDLDDNPALDEGYKSNIRRSYSGVFFQRYILGKWVVAEGAIYADSWSDDLLYNDDTRPVGLLNGYVDRYIGIDYGTANACVFVDCLDDGDTLWIEREYYWDSRAEGKQKTDSDYADDLLEFIGPKEDAHIILDPSAASFAAELRTRGVIVRDANNDVINGIRLVSSMFKRRMIRVHERCTNGIAETASYCWDEKAALRGEEKPLKTFDHFNDALRYLCATMIPAWRLAI